MAKPILVAVHGMGNPTKESFKKEISTALTDALKLYPGYEDKKVEDYLQVEVIEYNHIFETWRKKISDDAANTINYLDLSSSKLNLIKEGLDAHANIADDDNLYTHWLDVLFYMTLVGEHVRVSVAEQFTKIYKDALSPTNNNPEISIIATSLGTAVTHDTLSKLYMGDPTNHEFKEKWKELKIEANDFSLQALFQIANVSPLLETFSNPYTSIVRPGEKGCCNYMYSFDHGLDPIANLVPFEPDNNGNWLTNDEWSDRIFVGERIHEITQVNVHDLGHYIANPNVHLRIFRTLIPEFIVNPEDAKKVFITYLDSTLHKNVKALRKDLKGIKITDSKSIKEIIDAFKKSAAIIKTYEDLV